MSTDIVTPAAPEAPAAPAAPDAVAEEKKAGRPALNKTDYRAKDAPKLTEWPADYDSKAHKPLKADDFEKEDAFWDHKADEAERRAKTYRSNADLFRQYGSAEKRKAVESMSKHLEKLMALKAELEAGGHSMADFNIDLSAIMGN